MRVALLLLLTLPTAAPGFEPPLADPGVRLRAETILDATRWQGARVTSEARTDVRQRLGMDGFLRTEGPRMSVSIDLEVGSDFGPEGDAWRVQPDARRVVMDVYAARLDLRSDLLDASLGRQILYDVLGVDALDGLSIRLRGAPFLTLEAAGGLAARRAWSSFGPDVFEPDGVGLADDPGFVLRTRLSTRGLPWLTASAGWTRHFDTVVQREQAAVEAQVGPEILHVNGQLRHAIAVRELEDVAVGLGSDLGGLRLNASWRRHRPVFSADSIWNAFRREPWTAWEAGATGRVGPFDLAADGAIRTWSAGPARSQTPGLTAAADAPTVADATATEGGVSLSHAYDSNRPGARVGIEGRAAAGHGGARHYGDVFAQVPWLYALGREPVWLRARVGAVGLGATDRDDTAVSGWALLAAEWLPEETIRLEALGELFAGGPEPARLRMMLRLRLEEGW